MKLSEIMKEMAESVLDMKKNPSPEALQAALLFSTVAWNSTIDMKIPVFAEPLQALEASNPGFWEDLRLRKPEVIIAHLAKYKQRAFPQDRRQIAGCGVTETGNIRVEWTESNEN